MNSSASLVHCGFGERAFVAESPKDEWNMLFFMQHYGVPTRLLDWTENPLIALYFAVMSSPFTVETKKDASTLKFFSDAHRVSSFLYSKRVDFAVPRADIDLATRHHRLVEVSETRDELLAGI